MAQPDYKPHERSPLAPCPMDRNVVYVKSDCGCTIEGCGHLPDPVRPKLCAKHAAAPDLYEALRELRSAWCLNACDAASPDEGLNHLPECYAARDALAKADGDAA